MLLILECLNIMLELDPIDQLRFMLDQGFTAFEDNNMKKRDVELQKKMGAFMSKNNMKMGVFVGHTIYWKATLI